MNTRVAAATTGKESTGVIAFEPRARLMKLIGGELVSDEVVAVTELVKNAYDADASRVVVTFRNVLDPGGEIVISDDGHGMDLNALSNYWMQPGGTTKGLGGTRRSRKGRRMLGEKGIGRFAVDKLGTGLELTSRQRGQSTELHVRFDWAAFEHETRMLADVGSPWTVRPAREIKTSGTVLRITGLRSRWTERLFRRLCSRLARLMSPFQRVDNFRIVMESDDFPDYAGEIAVDFLDRAPHRLEAEFDGDQLIHVIPAGGRPRQLNWNGAGSLSCGPVRIRLFAYDLETDAIARVGPTREVRSWLKEWTGISVYRDGFRVWPYGESHDDWLRLDQRRVNNPAVHISNNQVIGFVEIGRDTNPDLVDQTNREGLIHNRAYDDLSRLVHFVLQQLEVERQRSRRPAARERGKKLTSFVEQESVADEIEKLARKMTGKQAITARALARRVKDNAERDSERYRVLAAGYAELAAVGQVASGFSANASSIIASLAAELEQLTVARGGAVQVRKIRALLEGLESRLAVLAPVEARHSVRRRAIDVHQALEETKAMFAGALNEHGVAMEIEAAAGVVRAEIRPENFHRLMHILITNSLDWLVSTERPRITVRVRTTPEHCEIVFSDNGPGIPGDMAEVVFEPLFTGREGARGMGLTIARNIVEAAAGTIRVLVDGRKRGAHILVSLRRKRARAVRHQPRG